MAVIEETKLIREKYSLENVYIFHVDLDCFFAAIEMREDPSLIGKPVIVGGDKETKRGVVTTCNYEARKYGIHSGMSAIEAIKLCPEVICIKKGHYDLYKEVSDNVMMILSSYTDKFRSASIDEAYLNLTEEVINDYSGNPIILAEEIKNEIFNVENITCSIGIGPNTTIAKIATSQNKPNGITYVPKEEIKDFLAPLPLRRISGIGPKTANSLREKYGVETVADIMIYETEFALIRKFGKLGSFFYRIISGEGRTIIEPNNSYGVKSISKGRTFYGLIKDGEQVTAEKIIPELIDSVHNRLIKKKFRYKTITLELKFQNNFKNINKSKSFSSANNDKKRIIITINDLLADFKNIYKKDPIRKVAIRLSNFEKYDPKQTTLSDFF